MDHSTYRGLAFLLSLGTLPLACKPDADEPTDSGTGNGTDSIGTTGTPTSSGMGTDGTGTDGGVTDGSATGTGTTGGTTGGGAAGCEAQVEFEIMCNPEDAGMKDELIAECEAQRKMTETINGPACAALFDVFYGCAVDAGCDAQDPCPDELEAALGCFPEPGAACMAYAAKYIECFPNYASYPIGGYCQRYINYGAYNNGPGCGAAIEELQVCLSGLACADLEIGMGCEDAQMKADQDCGFGGGAPARPVPRARGR